MRRIFLLQTISLLLITGFIFFITSEMTLAESGKSETMTIDKVKIKIVDAPNGRGMYRKMAQRLIRLKSGDQLTQEKIKASLNALSLSNRFATIHVDTQSTSKGENVVFTLKPFRFIKKIIIHGNYPLFEKDVLNQMTIYSGDVFRPEELQKQATAIKERFRREGYVDPRVDVTAENGTETDNVTIQVNIKKGRAYLPGKLILTGNHAIGVTLLKPRMKSWRTGLLLGAIRFTEKRLKEDVERLKRYYRNNGYCEINIDYELDRKSRFPKVDVKLYIQEGPRYAVAFEGNGSFSDYTLKKDLVIFKEGNRHELGLRKSIKNIKSRYLKEGFMEAKVVTRSKIVTEDSGNIRVVHFVIDEGPRTIVSDLTINGNVAIDGEKIGEQILTRAPGLFHSGAFDQEILNEDIFAIQTLYSNEGYQDAKVEAETIFTEERRYVAVVINIQEGQRTLVESVSLKDSDLISLDKVKSHLRVRTGSPFREAFLKDDENYISGQISEKGYPHVIVESKLEFNSDRTGVAVVYDIAPGPRVYLGQIFVSGNLKTKEKIILRELGIKPEEPLMLQKMVDGQRDLRDLDIFRSVQFKAIGLKEKQDTVNLFVEVQESKPYYVQTSVGYHSDALGMASITMGDNNFLGLNKSISSYAEKSNGGHDLSLSISEPRLFGSKTSANLSVYNKYMEESNLNIETEEYGAALGFGRKWAENWDLTLSFAVKQIKTSEEPPIRTVFETIPSVTYDNRDSFIRPTKGGVASLSISIPKGFEFSNDDFVKYKVGLSYYFTPIERITLAWQGRIGHIEPYAGNENVPKDQRLSLGGTNSVRGFDEDMLRRYDDGTAQGGRTTIFGNFEIRFDMGRNWEFATFFDTGSVQNAIREEEAENVEGSDEFRSSVGVGLRYITPVGPIGFMYGRKLEVKKKENKDKWHFSIGYTF